MQEMVIDSIRYSVQNYGQRVVILRQKDSSPGIYLPIWIGASEAESIAMRLQEIDAPRPLTHDLLTTAIDSLGAKVLSVVVSDLKNDTEYKMGGILGSAPYDDIQLCLKDKDIMENKMDKFFEVPVKESAKQDKHYDPTGNSKTYITQYFLENGFLLNHDLH